jgi:N4-bis(aminopropyl)spermidine synthase
LPDAAVEDVARAVGLAEGVRGVEAVLAALARLEPVSTRALGRAVDLPVPIVAAVCGELRQRGIVSEIRPVQFTLEGRRRFASAVATVDASCPTCGGRGIVLAPPVARLRRGLAAVGDAAPSPLVELDQCHCTPKTKLRRVVAMHAADAINGRRILLLGDDDLMSIALLRFVSQFGGSIEELVVADVDERLLEFIAGALDEAPFPFRCVRWDVREARAGRFDTVVTDPPYTVAGARLFLARAVENLAGAGSNVFLSFGSRRPGVQLEVQREIMEAGLEIRSLTRDFNDYVGAGVLGGTSHLYHLTMTAGERPPAGPFYTGGRSGQAVAIATCSESVKPSG